MSDQGTDAPATQRDGADGRPSGPPPVRCDSCGGTNVGTGSDSDGPWNEGGPTHALHDTP